MDGGGDQRSGGGRQARKLMAARVTTVALEVLMSSAVEVATTWPVSGSTMVTLTGTTFSGGTFRESATTTLMVGGNANVHNTSAYVNAATRVNFSQFGNFTTPWLVSGTEPVVTFTSTALASRVAGPMILLATATTGIYLSSVGREGSLRAYSVNANTTVSLSAPAIPLVFAHLLNGVTAGFQFTDSATVSTDRQHGCCHDPFLPAVRLRLPGRPCRCDHQHEPRGGPRVEQVLQRGGNQLVRFHHARLRCRKWHRR